MSTELESKDLINIQQMEVAVNGPDGATHLIICAGVANLGGVNHKTYTFLVGPQLSRRQFVGAVASGTLSTIQVDDHTLKANNDKELRPLFVTLIADYDDEAMQVKVIAEVSSNIVMTKLAISYNVSILAELSSC
jgi:hypothetical protein